MEDREEMDEKNLQPEKMEEKSLQPEKTEDKSLQREGVGEKRFLRDVRREDVRECCRSYWIQRLPLLMWIRDYNINYLINDMIAGITVGLTAIPQGVAYAVVAGLEPQYGLYSGYVACIVYFFLGTVKEVTIGPTAIMALLVHNNVEKYNSDFAVLTCFLAGCLTLSLGILHMGFLVNFISLPVTVGFTTAAALTIATTQLKPLFGLHGKSARFISSLISTFKQIGNTRFEDLGLGLFTIAFLVGTKILNDKVSKKRRNSLALTKRARFYARSIRILSLARNGVAVIFGTVLAYVLDTYGLCPFTLTGKVGEGPPTFSLPPFSTYATVNNETVYLPFEEMLSILGTTVISLPIISILETVAIGKIFVTGNSLNATQEMIALGVANFLGSFVQSMPTAGSFTRSVINSASGVKTPLAGLFTAVTVLSALAITRTFSYIPKASLAGVILTAMFFMIDFHEFVLIWKVKKLDMIPLWVTILATLFIEIDLGILLGTLVNLFFVLYVEFRPKIVEEELTVLGEEIIVLHLKQTPLYVGADYVRNSVMKYLKSKKKALVVIEGKQVLSTDSTTIRTFKMLTESLEKHRQEYAFWNWPPKYKKLCSGVSSELGMHFYNTETIEELVEMTIFTNKRNA